MTERRAVTFYELLRPAKALADEPGTAAPATVEYGVPMPPEAEEVIASAPPPQRMPEMPEVATSTVYTGGLVTTAQRVAASARKPAKIVSRCCGKVR